MQSGQIVKVLNQINGQATFLKDERAEIFMIVRYDTYCIRDRQKQRYTYCSGFDIALVDDWND